MKIEIKASRTNIYSKDLDLIKEEFKKAKIYYKDELFYCNSSAIHTTYKARILKADAKKLMLLGHEIEYRYSKSLQKNKQSENKIKIPNTIRGFKGCLLGVEPVIFI
jgi:hypothetical protein